MPQFEKYSTYLEIDPPYEEEYGLEDDPHETKNLIEDEAFREEVLSNEEAIEIK